MCCLWNYSFRTSFNCYDLSFLHSFLERTIPGFWYNWCIWILISLRTSKKAAGFLSIPPLGRNLIIPNLNTIRLITISDQEDMKRHRVSVARQHFVVLRGQFALKHEFLDYYCYYSSSFLCGTWHPVKSSTTPPALLPLCSKFLFQLSSNPLQISPSIFSLFLPFRQSLFVLTVFRYSSFQYAHTILT